jgi:hypothetical protein
MPREVIAGEGRSPSPRKSRLPERFALVQGGLVTRSDRYRGRAVRERPSHDLDDALAALSADELRAFVRDALERLDDGPRGDLADLLLMRAVRGKAGWKPAAPAPAFVEEAKKFIAAARTVAHADPSDIDDILRQALTASLAGDHVSARAVFETVLAPICHGDIDLGQHEMVDEVLSVDLYECGRRFMTAVYVTTPLAARADALISAHQLVHDVSYTQDPIEDVSKALDGDIPDLAAFLPLWIARLEADTKERKSDWETDHDRWLRAAIGRRDGAAGLARLARASKSSEAARAWCDALVERGDWAAALLAYEECASFVAKDYAKGEFLDGAALAAQVLGRKDLAKKLEAAWLGAPSLLRLSRWLLVGKPTAATIRKRAVAALDEMPTKAPVVVAFLNLLVGKPADAAELLAKAPGLGWSHGGHPGHVVFGAFAWMLGGERLGPLTTEVTAALAAPSRDLFDFDSLSDQVGDSSDPRLPRPTLLEVLQRAEVARQLRAPDRRQVLDAMKAAAEHRTDGVIGEKRRRHYEHAAQLVGSVLENDPASTTWAEALRVRTSRWPAFQGALREAIGRATKHS